MTLKELLDYVKENNVPETVVLRLAVDDLDSSLLRNVSWLQYTLAGNLYIVHSSNRKPETTIGIGKL